MDFEWDDAKAASNLEKHGISFEVAAKVFLDENAITIQDLRFEYGEERFITYGQIDGRIYVVVFTLDDERNIIRLISARKANARERSRYGDDETHD